MITNQNILLIAIILMLIDVFVPTEISTLIAYVLFSYLIGQLIDVPILYQIVIGIVSWWAMVALHYYVFRKYIRLFTNQILAPNKLNSGIAIHFGKTGQIIEINNKLMFRVEDELYSFIEQNNLPCSEGQKGTVIDFQDNNLIIQINS